MKNFKSILLFFIMFSVFLTGVPISLISGNDVNSLVLFDSGTKDLSDWNSKWNESPGSPGAIIKKSGNVAVIKGKLENQNFAAMYQKLTLNVDKYPYIEIEVKDVSSHWYLIISGEEIKNGYVKIQEDTYKTGKLKYNVKNKLGLSGEITFDLQVGVSEPQGKSCDGLTISFRQLKFFNQSSLKKKKAVKYFDFLSDELYANIGDWYPGWGEGAERVTIKKEKDGVLIEGKEKNQTWEALHRNITLDIDKYPLLEVEVKSVTDQWFLIISSDKIKKGYIKIQEDTNKVGKFTYNLKKILGLTGQNDIVLQIGVSVSGKKKSAGSKVVLKKIQLSKEKTKAKK